MSSEPNPVQLLDDFVDNSEICVDYLKPKLKVWLRMHHSTDEEKKIIRRILSRTNSKNANQASVIRDFEPFIEKMLRLDAVDYVSSCSAFYAKYHKLTEFQVDSTMSQDSVLDMFRTQGLGQLECNNDRYQRFRNKPKRPSERKVGPFNKFIRDQWSERRDELRAVAKEKGSTGVMQKLGQEWRNDEELRNKYRTSKGEEK